MPPVSLYIPCYNGQKYIARCLEAALALDPAPDEIMVVDDGSTDDTAAIVKRYPQVRLLQQGINKGLAAARNRALREARNELVANIDADVAVSRTWLGDMLKLIDECPQYAAYGGYLEETVSRTLGDQWRNLHMPQNLGKQRVIGPKHLPGANGLVRKSVVLELGGFDERMRTNGEDVNIAYRMSQIGQTILYDPTPLAYHMREDTIDSTLRNYWAWCRHPWVVLFPHKSWGDVYRHLRRRHWRYIRHKVIENWRNQEYKLFAFSLWFYVDHAIRESRAYLKMRKAA